MNLFVLMFGGVLLMFGLVVFRGAPYVPTRRKFLEGAFDNLYKLGKDDVLVDIGSGDGVVLRAAATRGARAIGYELNPVLVIVSRLISRNPLISVRFADFWRVELPRETTVIYTFGESRDISKMYEKAVQTAARHKKTIHFISFGFAVPDEEPIKQDKSFYMYKIVPKKSK